MLKLAFLTTLTALACTNIDILYLSCICSRVSAYRALCYVPNHVTVCGLVDLLVVQVEHQGIKTLVWLILFWVFYESVFMNGVWSNDLRFH